MAAPQAQDMTCRRVKNNKGDVDEDEKRRNRTKARVRAKVEWSFRILKRVFGYTKVRYRGIVKKHQWHLVAFARVNLYMNRKRLVLQKVECLRGPADGPQRQSAAPCISCKPLEIHALDRESSSLRALAVACQK